MEFEKGEGGGNRTKREIREEMVGEDKGQSRKKVLRGENDNYFHEIHCHPPYHFILIRTFLFPQDTSNFPQKVPGIKTQQHGREFHR